MKFLTLEKPTVGDFFKTFVLKKHLECDYACNVMIYGPSGVGKSSLALRSVEAIWDPSRDELDHIFNEHIIYTTNDYYGVLRHVFLSDCDFPVLVYMESREVYDARRTMSNMNRELTRIAQLARAVKRTYNIFCTQRRQDIDIRIRSMVHMGIRVVRYGLSSGKSTPVFGIPYSTRQLMLDEDKMTPDIFARIRGDSTWIRVGSITWKMPTMFDRFKEIDREKKVAIIFKDRKESREEEKEEEVSVRFDGEEMEQLLRKHLNI
jgi:energy-coupling factor transporter ATP-binding protein EcfA2